MYEKGKRGEKQDFISASLNCRFWYYSYLSVLISSQPASITLIDPRIGRTRPGSNPCIGKVFGLID